MLSSRVVTFVRDELLAPYRGRMNATERDELHTTLLEGRDTPSTGLMAVFLMIQLCKKVTVFGFSGMVRHDSTSGNGMVLAVVAANRSSVL
eukprot:scaffold1535_cov382-Prasinococcus_capsulatus_cf.AAC.28